MLVDLRSRVRVEDLAEGNIFDGDELIIERNENSMRTISKWWPDVQEIRLNSYCITRNNKRVSVDYDGYTEILEEDFDYLDYINKLRERGLAK